MDDKIKHCKTQKAHWQQVANAYKEQRTALVQQAKNLKDMETEARKIAKSWQAQIDRVKEAK